MKRAGMRPSSAPSPVLSVVRTSCRSSYSRPRPRSRRVRCRTVPRSYSDLHTHVLRYVTSNHSQLCGLKHSPRLKTAVFSAISQIYHGFCEIRHTLCGHVWSVDHVMQVCVLTSYVSGNVSESASACPDNATTVE